MDLSPVRQPTPHLEYLFMADAEVGRPSRPRCEIAERNCLAADLNRQATNLLTGLVDYGEVVPCE